MELRKRGARRFEESGSGDENETPPRSRARGRPRATARGKSYAAPPPPPSPPPSPGPERRQARGNPAADNPMDIYDDINQDRSRLHARTRATARNRAAFYAHYDPSKDELHLDFTDELGEGGDQQKRPERVKVVDWCPSRDAQAAKQYAAAAAAASPQSLFNKCLELLCSNIYGVESLEGVPEAIKSSILLRLMELGKIRLHAARLFTSGVVSRIAIPDCSKLTPEELTEMFHSCFLDGVESLELGFCGRPLRDEFLVSHRFTHLKKVRIHGNYLVTDTGIRALVSASRGLTDIQLVHCTLLTESSVEAIVSCLGENLRRLSLEDCSSMRGEKLAPFLVRLTGLTGLSLARVEDVTDELLGELMLRIGGNLEELDLSGCSSVSDQGIGAVGACCARLKSLHLQVLPLLTDQALRSLAEGCKSLAIISLDESRNFSDEEIANLFTACGSSLREVSVRVVRQAGDKCLVALAEHAKLTLQRLDASFCRKMSDDGFGHLADSCASLEQLTLFGCSQITDKFVYGHSNKLLRLVRN